MKVSPQTDARVAHRSGPHRIDTLPPRTSLIDAEWDSPNDHVADAASPRARLPQLALVDLDDGLDPIITWFELDGPECLGLRDSELD
jgi:hypothetical protein